MKKCCCKNCCNKAIENLRISKLLLRSELIKHLEYQIEKQKREKNVL